MHTSDYNNIGNLTFNKIIMKHINNKVVINVVLGIMILIPNSLLAQSNIMPDVMPAPMKSSAVVDTLKEMILPESISSSENALNSDLNIENLISVLEKYNVKEKKIVLAQALLETGYFSSTLCLESHNLFGLRHPSDGSYYTFNNWEESVKAYMDDVQYKYNGGDYYAFLKRIGYAEDRNYTNKVRRIANRLNDINI